MDKKEILLFLDEVQELLPGTLTGNENIENWNSISIITLMALTDDRYGIQLTAKQLEDCDTVDDIIKLLSIETCSI